MCRCVSRAKYSENIGIWGRYLLYIGGYLPNIYFFRSKIYKQIYLTGQIYCEIYPTLFLNICVGKYGEYREIYGIYCGNILIFAVFI